MSAGLGRRLHGLGTRRGRAGYPAGAGPVSRPGATMAALTVTLGPAAACWIVAVWQMAMLVALGVMSIPWMALITILILGQKLLPARAAIDVPLALAVIGLGILIILAPSSIPGLTPM